MEEGFSPAGEEPEKDVDFSRYWAIVVKRWRLIHRFTLLAWAAGILHAVTEGTDAGQAWFILLALLCVGPVLGLLAGRVGFPRPLSRLSRRPVAS